MNVWTVCYLCKHPLELTQSESDALRADAQGRYFVKVNGVKREYHPDKHAKERQPLCSGCLLRWFVERDASASAAATQVEWDEKVSKELFDDTE